MEEYYERKVKEAYEIYLEICKTRSKLREASPETFLNAEKILADTIHLIANAYEIKCSRIN